VENVLRRDPLTGHIFVFTNRHRNRLKLLFWDRTGLWVCAKRLEKGTFFWPEAGEASVEMTAAELALILGGIDLKDTRRRRWYERRSVEPAVEGGGIT
jgi:transposase